MERTYTEEIALLRLGQGQLFHGEGIMAVTKALLQSGVAYAGGYQGAPVTALLDVLVLVSAKELLRELGHHRPHGRARVRTVGSVQHARAGDSAVGTRSNRARAVVICWAAPRLTRPAEPTMGLRH